MYMCMCIYGMIDDLLIVRIWVVYVYDCMFIMQCVCYIIYKSSKLYVYMYVYLYI